LLAFIAVLHFQAHVNINFHIIDYQAEAFNLQNTIASPRWEGKKVYSYSYYLFICISASPLVTRIQIIYIYIFAHFLEELEIQHLTRIDIGSSKVNSTLEDIL
jgi:hypothetical protein